MLILTHENMFLNQIIISVTQQASECQRLTVSLSLVHLQILQGNAWGHSGIRRHECRVLRQRQTMATWNQPELWRRVPNIRWVCTFHCSDRVRGLSSPRHPWSKNRLYPWIERTPVLWVKLLEAPFPKSLVSSHLSQCSFFSGKQKRRPQLQGGRDDWRAEVCGADGDQPVWDECEREHQRRRGNSPVLLCLASDGFRGLMCLRGDVSGTCLLCGADQPRVWIRQRFWMLCRTFWCGGVLNRHLLCTNKALEEKALQLRKTLHNDVQLGHS